jgi:hypothetical protein
VVGPVLAETHYDKVMRPFEAELARQCPAKRLERLSPADLRDVLDDYKSALHPSRRHALDKTEQRNCVSAIAGASCENVGDVEAANHLKLTRSLAEFVCAKAPACRSQSDCG